MTDRVTDSLGRSWERGAPLGRGTWGRSYEIRAEGDGREAVLKVPLRREDFPADVAVPDELVAACATIAREQAEQLQEAVAQPATPQTIGPPRLEATVDLGDGRVGLVLPRYATLARRLASGLPHADILKLAHRVAGSLTASHRAHGNLRPSNVLFGERGEVHLADPATPTLTRHLPALAEHAAASAWLPPEARKGTRVPAQRLDTWALTQMLWLSLMEQVAADGVDKLEVASARDRAHARFGSEGSNPRFRGRVAEREGALLSRGLSHDADPSPPYRFDTCRELADRVAEVLALIRPKVVDVGRLLPPSTAPDGVFVGDGPVSFSVTVGGTPGVTDPDDLVCGLHLVDLDGPGDGRVPVEDAAVDVQVHPSGRLRFALSLGGIRPGRYRLRVAFAVKDSGDEPQVALGEFQVRPPPGYVPPPAEPSVPSAIPFPGGARQPADAAFPSEPGEERLTDPGEFEDRASDPGSYPGPASVGRDPTSVGVDETPATAQEAEAPRVVHAFPRPVAPPTEPDPEPTPPPRPAPVVAPARPAPALRALPDIPEDEGLDTEELLADTDDAAPVAPLPKPPTPASPSPHVSLPPPPPMLADAAQAPAAGDPPSDVAFGDELPGYGDGAEIGGRTSGMPAPLAAAVEILRRDRYLSLGVAVAASLLLVLSLTLLLKAC
ncbi:MAG: hypothetical protein KC621_01145 [Myxococcales bacterium]|nr:hypothetical protein [Myxococcales bacterium]